jgi:hypothetical protein
MPAAFTDHLAAVPRVTKYTLWSQLLEDERIFATWDGLSAQATGGVGAMENTWKIPSQPDPKVTLLTPYEQYFIQTLYQKDS